MSISTTESETDDISLAPKIETFVQLITPELAREYLRQDCDIQRPIREQVVARYAALMTKGQWVLTHQGIALDEIGRLVDGRHRCSAVVRSGVSVEMTVFVNVSSDSFKGMDQGYSRTAVQLARMSGLDWVSAGMCATVNTLRWQIASSNTCLLSWTTEEMEILLRAYKKQIKQVFPAKFSGINSLKSAPIRGAVLRALIAHPEKAVRLSQFICCIATNTVTTGVADNAALMLRSKMVSKISSSDKQQRHLDWGLTLTALEHFLAGTQPKSQSSFRDVPKKQPFPIFFDEHFPEETIAIVKNLQLKKN